jgi:hypothetical protein
LTAFDPHVEPIFATPFGRATLPGASALNGPAAALFAERATADRADPASRLPLMFRSRDDLMQWSDAPVRALLEGICGAALAVVRSINAIGDEQFAALQLQARAWYTIVRPDGHVPSHNYSNAAWCAVYCVAAPPPATAARFDSGQLRLHESARVTMFSDATNTVMRDPYQLGHRTWRPEPGQLALFPASVTHEIALLRGSGELQLVTMLLRLIAPGQTGMPWW